MTPDLTPENDQDPRLEKIATHAYKVIASAYPVCCASDEFYFFPQVVLPKKNWCIWDDFSTECVAGACEALLDFERSLIALDAETLGAADRVDAELLQHVMRSLREQLLEFEPHRTQPTFHLTTLAAGLAEALGSGEPRAWEGRVAGAPGFLQRAGECLDAVPLIFKALGVDMLRDLQGWIKGLSEAGYSTGELLPSLKRFEAVLQCVSIEEDYCLPGELLEKLVCEHVDCRMDTDSLLVVLKEELLAMKAVLEQEAESLAPGKSWREVEARIPFVEASGEGLLSIYRHELKGMEKHCHQLKLVPEKMLGTDLGVEIVPEALAAVRASDAYAASPGYPPQGGTFYVMEHARAGKGPPGRTLEYRMTAVHEAWPGHHLLDSCRWGLQRSLRRPLESPLFYEGWACLAEELMVRTGYLDGVWDRFLLAKRRAERAARGMIDVGLQSGRMHIGEAEALLVDVGYRRELARAVVPKYLLRPGYQVCYTLGLKQALDLLDKYGKDDVGLFSRTLLQEGEIGFSRLEKVFSEEKKRSQV